MINAKHWFIIIGLILLAGLVISSLEWLLHKQLLPLFKKKKYIFRSALLSALHFPFQICLWLMVITFVLYALFHVFVDLQAFFSSWAFLRQLIVMVFIFWFGMRCIREVESNMLLQAKGGIGKIHDQTNILVGAQLCRAAIIVILLLMVLQTAGIKLSALLAFGGVGFAVLGFAAKDMLGNYFGGLMIYWNRPFSVGDWVRSPDRQIEGTVEHIGWRLTCIRNFESRLLFVPNGILSNIIIENPSRMTNRRIRVLVGVRYEDSGRIATLTKAIEDMLRAHDEIDTNRTLFVAFSEFGPSSLNLLVYAFIKSKQWIKFQNVQQALFLQIINLIEQHGAECAFPTRTVYFPEGFVLAKSDNIHLSVQR